MWEPALCLGPAPAQRHAGTPRGRCLVTAFHPPDDASTRTGTPGVGSRWDACEVLSGVRRPSGRGDGFEADSFIIKPFPLHSITLPTQLCQHSNIHPAHHSFDHDGPHALKWALPQGRVEGGLAREGDMGHSVVLDKVP